MQKNVIFFYIKKTIHYINVYIKFVLVSRNIKTLHDATIYLYSYYMYQIIIINIVTNKEFLCSK